jgi:hypothetical protein
VFEIGVTCKRCGFCRYEQQAALMQRPELKQRIVNLFRIVTVFHSTHLQGKSHFLIRSGYGVLEIEIANGIHVSTNNNSFSDIGDHTLIAPDSPIYQTLLGLKPQTEVRFSGSFFNNSDSDCVREHSLTMNGSMTEPDFLFRFTAVDEQTDGGPL